MLSVLFHGTVFLPTAIQSLTGTQTKHAIRDSSSHLGVKAPPTWFPARAEFLAV